jgi:hypothetical protein
METWGRSHGINSDEIEMRKSISQKNIAVGAMAA